MKKRAFSVILAMMMLFTLFAPASAKDMVPSDENTDSLEIMPVESLDSRFESAGKMSQASVNDNGIMPLDNLHPLTPLGLLVYPTFYQDGNLMVVTDERAVIYSPPLNFQNYISTNISREKQEEIKNLLSSAGYEQVGWFMNTGYNLEVYRPIRRQYYFWTGSGKSALNTDTAKNGDTYFRLVTFFAEEVSSSYKFGMTGTVTYETSPTSSTATIPIELSVTFR